MPEEYLSDGFPTKVSFGSTTLSVAKEQSVTPPSIDGGGGINMTTMYNTDFRTALPKSVKTVGDMSLKVVFKPSAYTEIINALQQNQEITVTFPDGGTLVFYGWIDKFEPGELTEGGEATATITIVASNIDPSTGDEASPVLTPAT